MLTSPMSCKKILSSLAKFDTRFVCSQKGLRRSSLLSPCVAGVRAEDSKLFDFENRIRKKYFPIKAVWKLREIKYTTSQSNDTLEKKLSKKKVEEFRRNYGVPTNRVKNFDKISMSGVKWYSEESAISAAPLSRHNYHEEVEAAINNQILAEFNASYAYLSMSCYFGRSDVALFGTSAFFMKMYEEEVQHGLNFIKYQNLRGGHVKLCPITTVECSDWCSIGKSLEVSLEMEKLLLDKLLDLIKCAEKHKDVSTQEMVTTCYIKEQHQSVSQLAGLLTRVTKLGICGMSEYLFDKELATTSGHK